MSFTSLIEIYDLLESLVPLMVSDEILTRSTEFSGAFRVYELLNVLPCSSDILKKLEIYWNHWSLQRLSMRSLLDQLDPLVPAVFIRF